MTDLTGTAGEASSTGDGEPEFLPPHRARLLAAAVDVVPVVMVVCALLLLGSLVVPAARSPWWLAVVAAVCVVLLTGLELAATGGETLGKAALGLRVRRVSRGTLDRSPRDLRWCLTRQGGYLVVDVLGLGFLLAFRTRRRQALHDLVVGSLVVYVPPPPDVSELPPRSRAWQRARDFEERVRQGIEELSASYAWLTRRYRRIVKLIVYVAAVVFWLADRADAALPGGGAARDLEPLDPTTGQAGTWGTATSSGVGTATSVATVGLLVVTYPGAAYTNINVATNFGTVGEPETQEIYLMKADGGELERLTHNDVPDRDPDLWHDERIVFSRTGDEGASLWLMASDGSGEERLTDGDGDDTDPVWSPDGSTVAFTRTDGSGPRVWTVERSGGSPRQATELSSRWPTWSPDGETLAFVAADEDGVGLFTLDTDAGARPRRVTAPEATEQPRQPDWSPDGEWIVYADGAEDAADVYVVRADGGDPRRVTRDPAHDYGAFWTPDGEALLFRSGRGLDSGDELWLVRPDGSGLRQMTDVNVD